MGKPRSYAEIYNDLDGEVVNLFRVLRDPDQATELERRLRLTPFSRVEFEWAYNPTDDAIESARRIVVRSFCGFGSASASPLHRTGFRSNSNRSHTTPAHDWRAYPDLIAAFTSRLAGVVIECRDAAQVIRAHDSPDTLIYADPPYPHGVRSMRGRKGAYRHEMTDDQHRELAATLRAAVGMVVLSGYACDLYDVELYPDWERHQRQALADGARKRTEVLWLNPACSTAWALPLDLAAAEAP